MGAVRILFLNQTFHPDPVATSQYLARWAARLAAEGDEVTVLASPRAYHDSGRLHPAREVWQGVRIVRIWSSGRGRRSRWGRVLDGLAFLAGAAIVGRRLPRPDVIVALTSPPLLSVVAAWLARARGAKLVCWIMDLHPDAAVAAGWLKPRDLLTRLAKTLSRWSLCRAEQIVVLDRFMRERLISLGVLPERIEVIGLGMQAGVRFDAAGRKAFRMAHRLEDKFVIMYAGNLGPCHPLDDLVNAAELVRHLSQLHFCFVGGGSERERLRWDRERTGGQNITLLDYVPFEDLSACLSAADLHVVAMGEPFVGVVHPCKIYNLLAAQRPFLYLGPAEGPIADIIREAKLETWTSTFRFGESRDLARELIQRSEQPALEPWPAERCEAAWSEPGIHEKMTTVLRQAGR